MKMSRKICTYVSRRQGAKSRELRAESGGLRAERCVKIVDIDYASC
jgi:hypothetical protein